MVLIRISEASGNTFRGLAGRVFVLIISPASDEIADSDRRGAVRVLIEGKTAGEEGLWRLDMRRERKWKESMATAVEK